MNFKKSSANETADGYSTNSTSKTPTPRRWFCKSTRCCIYISRTSEYFDKKTGERREFNSYSLKSRIFKLEAVSPTPCPDCGEPLFATTQKYVGRSTLGGQPKKTA